MIKENSDKSKTNLDDVIIRNSNRERNESNNDDNQNEINLIVKKDKSKK